ncbi:follistatin-related protein 1 isoform X2 [Drosophila subpulchrella]|uniref:follistatin-related protein 1 isoform X1 n=1 Tax=Drosophila subpulchrella TaxID=1486046 RepID=UPI0018A16D2D|nr:follistatin-related protein 1 isoform X1 [Drosophila subpulchrella]XP_037719687.1 follistatin-related protein 1 isoform X2 [Drosophila subpulchrella]
MPFRMHNLASGSERNIYLAWFLISDFIMFLALSMSLPVIGSSSACKVIGSCDPFLPVCAASTNEHQFFYSHCEMLRDACLTGKDWKSDYFSHCNVSKL